MSTLTPKRLKLTPFKINLINEELEAQFKIKLVKDNRIKLLILLILNFLLILALIIIFFLCKNITNSSHLFIGIIVIIQSMIMVIAILLYFLWPNKVFIQSLCSMLNYFLLSLFFINGRRILRYSFNIDALVYDWLFYIDILIKALWIALELSDYPYILIANGIAFVIGKSLAIYYDEWPIKLAWNLLVSDCFLCIITGMSYITMKNSRFLFSYINEITEQKTWFLDIVNNMNSGFLTIRNDQIYFANTTIIDMFIKIGLFRNNALEEEEVEGKINQEAINITPPLLSLVKENPMEINDHMKIIQQKSTSILKALFKEVQFCNYQNSNTSREEDVTVLSFNNHESDQTLRAMLFDKIKKTIQASKIPNDKFVYIGRGKIYTKDNNTFQYEYYSRHYINEEGENYELLLNNVSRTKLIEEKNAEIRLKSLVLSKIAHEFKNPLLCMSEIIDDEKGSDAKQKEKNLTMIKSISNYLLVLVKNIDYFSQMQTITGITTNKKDSQLNITKCSISEIIDFIEMIVNYLLQKNKVYQQIKFNIIKKYHCDIIESDEIKIKQLLINLLSNALKFTTKGSITLTISLDPHDHSYLIFSVKDTGIGIPEVLQHDQVLFNSFSKAKRLTDNNKYGTGLGLAISKDLSILLGKGREIMFKSKENLGSEFWFSVFIGKSRGSTIAKKYSKNNSCTSLVTIRNEELVPLSLSMEQTNGTEVISSLGIAYNNSIANDKESTIIKKTVSILLADDEELIRQSTKRLLKNYAIKHNILLDISEASDGIEMMWMYFDKSTRNEMIDIIISDENMMFYSGNKAAQEIKDIIMKNGRHDLRPKFYLSSAYCEEKEMLTECIDGYFHKPLLSDDLDMIFNEYKCE